MPSVNLAPDTRLANQAKHRLQRLLGLSAGIVVLVAIIWGALFFYKTQLNQSNTEVQDRVRAVDMEIAKLENEAKRIVLFENRLVSLDTLLDSHMNWEPLLRGFETLLPPQTVLERVEFDSDQGIIRVAGSTPDVDSVAQTLASLSSTPNRRTVFLTGTMRSVERKETPVDGAPAQVRYVFSAELTFDPAVLRPES